MGGGYAKGLNQLGTTISNNSIDTFQKSVSFTGSKDAFNKRVEVEVAKRLKQIDLDIEKRVQAEVERLTKKQADDIAETARIKARNERIQADEDEKLAKKQITQTEENKTHEVNEEHISSSSSSDEYEGSSIDDAYYRQQSSDTAY